MTDYLRTVIHDDENCEVVEIAWPPGSRSRRHDHGESYGIVRVLEGKIYEERVGGRKQYEAGAVLLESPGMIHAMGNDSEEPARTHHMYSPKLKMNFYD